jgi:hypothetical protein
LTQTLKKNCERVAHVKVRRAPSTVREEEEQKGNKVINARYVLDGRPGEDVSVEPPS